MVTLLLVDDEPIIREGILRMIDWDNLGIRVSGDCANAYLALDIMRDETPDILMTDIRMPGMDGLTLIEQALKMHPKLQCVVLSGYDEFTFAQKAMRMGVRDYLLKPCSQAEMESTLSAVCRRVRADQTLAERERASAPDAVQERASALRPFIELMADYVKRNYHNPALSLQYLADHVVHMNADYIGKEFTREMGMRFSAYLMRVRMERAKRLLGASREMRMYEIAEMVGLGHNPQYFSRLFYSCEGVTPKEFRKSALAECVSDN